MYVFPSLCPLTGAEGRGRGCISEMDPRVTLKRVLDGLSDRMNNTKEQVEGPPPPTHTHLLMGMGIGVTSVRLYTFYSDV